MQLIKRDDIDAIIRSLPATPEVNIAILNTAMAIVEAINGFDATETPGADMAKNYERFKEIKGLPDKINKLRLDGLEEIRKIEKEFKSFVDSRVIDKINTVVATYRTCLEKYEEDQAEIKRKEEMERMKAMTKPEAERQPEPTKQQNPERQPEPTKQPEPAIEIKTRKMPYTYEVLDIKKVPAKYKKEVANDAMIKVTIKAGIREIEGLRIFQEKKIV